MAAKRERILHIRGRKIVNRNIPSDEDFARADAAMRQRDRGLSEVRSALLERFSAKGLHEAFIFYSPKK